MSKDVDAIATTSSIKVFPMKRVSKALNNKNNWELVFLLSTYHGLNLSYPLTALSNQRRYYQNV
ncbi:hypothetical protein [Nostoc sp. NMS8]|uniref:hypothetical protein n=1 Tax=Nostoc sp. NMS8 TaxID=2815392 RepID=UPI0025EC9BAA|nr:hypothetical protein [Nostoc sp. NMS8]MBN3960475.1 hypothetical protein [Nostoc sp. NMS8]